MLERPLRHHPSIGTSKAEDDAADEKELEDVFRLNLMIYGIPWLTRTTFIASMRMMMHAFAHIGDGDDDDDDDDDDDAHVNLRVLIAARVVR